MVTRPVGDSLQAGTENAPVLGRPEPLRRFHDFGARHKYPDLLTYLFTQGTVSVWMCDRFRMVDHLGAEPVVQVHSPRAIPEWRG